MQAFFDIFDVTLLATGGVIILITMFGAYLRSSRCDPCLESFNDYMVTLERADGKVIWGELELESTGFELSYRDSVQDSNHIESSYVLYGSEFSEIQALYRYVDELEPEERERRQRDLDKYFHPGLLVRLSRTLQHFFSLAGESLTEVLGMVMGRLRKPAGRYIGEVSDDHFMRFSNAVVGSVGSTFDPLLERFVGHKIVVEVVEDGEAHEHVAVFKNYSADFFELLDVQYPQARSLSLNVQEQTLRDSVTIVREKSTLRVTNHTVHPVLLVSLHLGANEEAEEEMLNVVVDGGETIELHPEEFSEDASLMLRVVRELDMVVPRARCIIRHRAERYEPTVIPEIIFDLGVMLRGNSRLDAKEERLRRQLEEMPDSAHLASNLGTVLMQKQQLREALVWLEKAYSARYALPDNGKRTLMLIHELRRRANKSAKRSTVIATEVQNHSLYVNKEAKTQVEVGSRSVS
jgi:hypothetical protein